MCTDAETATDFNYLYFWDMEVKGVSHFKISRITMFTFYLIFSVNGPVTGFIRRVIQQDTQANNHS